MSPQECLQEALCKMEQASVLNEMAQEAYEEAILAIEASGRQVMVKSPWLNRDNNDTLVCNCAKLEISLCNLAMSKPDHEHA